jgi:hypothetical protein
VQELEHHTHQRVATLQAGSFQRSQHAVAYEEGTYKLLQLMASHLVTEHLETRVIWLPRLCDLHQRAFPQRSQEMYLVLLEESMLVASVPEHFDGQLVHLEGETQIPVIEKR